MPVPRSHKPIINVLTRGEYVLCMFEFGPDLLKARPQLVQSRHSWKPNSVKRECAGTCSHRHSLCMLHKLCYDSIPRNILSQQEIAATATGPKLSQFISSRYNLIALISFSSRCGVALVCVSNAPRENHLCTAASSMSKKKHMALIEHRAAQKPTVKFEAPLFFHKT